MRRVAITGLGAFSALGESVKQLDEGLQAGRSGVRPLTLFDATGFRSNLAAQAPEPPDGDQATWSRPDRFGLAAAAEAIAMAGLGPGDLAEAALGFGTGTGGAMLTEAVLAAQLQGAPIDADLRRTLVPHQPCSVTDLVARRFAIAGPRTTVMTACSSSATAIGWAADRIRSGDVDVALGGGAEGLCRLTYAGFSCLRAIAPGPSQPFDQNRKGLNLGEAGAVLVLEEWEHARRRGATILGELAGYGISADAHHMTAPHPEGDGAARAMRAALADAGLPPEAIGYVNAHGTGTPHNDAAETKAIKAVFGAHAATLPVSSIKSMVGHTLGAAGAIEAVASVLSLWRGYLPPTVNHEIAEAGFDLDYIPGQARRVAVEAIVSNSFAFGGNNTALVFRRAS